MATSTAFKDLQMAARQIKNRSSDIFQQVKFKTKIFHPNASDKGDVYLYMPGNGWAPGFTIPDIIMMLWGMLLTPRLDIPDKVNEDTLEYVSNR